MSLLTGQVGSVEGENTPLLDERREMADKLRRLIVQRRNLDNDIKELQQELKESLEPGEIVEGYEGGGYVLKPEEKMVFPESVYQFLLDRNLLYDCVSVSRNRLEAFAKAGRLSQADLVSLFAKAEIKTNEVLRDYIPKEED